jgi:hypothetical protein
MPGSTQTAHTSQNTRPHVSVEKRIVTAGSIAAVGSAIIHAELIRRSDPRLRQSPQCVVAFLQSRAALSALWDVHRDVSASAATPPAHTARIVEVRRSSGETDGRPKLRNAVGLSCCFC